MSRTAPLPPPVDPHQATDDTSGATAAQAKKKRGLGRGLNALFSESEAAYAPSIATQDGGGDSAVQASAGDGVLQVPLDRIAPGRFQPRRDFDETALEELAASIKERGLIQPIILRPAERGEDGSGDTDYEIVAGERRWRACQRAGVHAIPAIIRPLSDAETLEAALVENLQREDLNAIDEALGLKRLADEFGHTQEAIAQAVGKSRSHVANLLRLIGLPEPVQIMVRDGRLSAGHARTLIGVPDAAILAHNIVERGLSVREAEKLAAAAKADPAAGRSIALKEAARQLKDPDVAALEQDLAYRLGLKVSIEVKGDQKSGRVTIDYRSLEQLDLVIAKLSR